MTKKTSETVTAANGVSFRNVEIHNVTAQGPTEDTIQAVLEITRTVGKLSETLTEAAKALKGGDAYGLYYRGQP